MSTPTVAAAIMRRSNWSAGPGARFHRVGGQSDQSDVLGTDEAAGIGNLVHQPLPGNGVGSLGVGQHAEGGLDGVTVRRDRGQLRGAHR